LWRSIFYLRVFFVCKKRLLYFACSFGLAQPYKGQVQFSKVPAPAYHYQEEYIFDTTLNEAAWMKQKKGLHVSFASTDQHILEVKYRSLKKKLHNGKQRDGKEND
jgi:hypothetical protein